MIHMNESSRTPEREETVRNTNLATARERAGKTQAQVAKEAGIAVRLYQYYEAGEKAPSVRTAIRIADTLGVADLRDLFG